MYKNHLEYFDKFCKDKPKNIALKFHDKTLTYSELYEKVNQLANYLIRKGATRGHLIGILAERSLHTIISMLAIHRIGAAYVPLDPTYPKDRLKLMIEDSGIYFIITTDHTSEIFSDLKIEFIHLEKLHSIIEKEDIEFDPVDIEPYDLAYVMYTSGSTGRPKGVMITYSNLRSFIELVPKVLTMRDDDIYLFTASITYALSVRQIFVPISQGVKLVIADSSVIQDPIDLFKLIRNEKITLVDFVPSHWRSCIVKLKTMNPEERDKLLNNNLRRIVTVGEPLLPDLPSEWKNIFKHPAQIVNIFGQTETTGLISSNDITDMKIDTSKVVSIGKPIPETKIYILKPESLSQVEYGEEGELCVSNSCIAKGYLNNPELTASKIIPNPFDHGLTQLYRTGDLAKFSSDGNIEYLGRIDQQVKIRGMRVELGEIESAILKADHVKDVAVVTQTREKYGNILIAFLAVKNEEEIKLDEIKQYIKSKLPPHMVPALFVTLKELPRTPNGKIDRKALMEYKVNTNGLGSVENKIMTDTEQKLLKIWKKLFKRSSIKTTDNFFDDLGGDSLLAVILFSEIEKDFGKNLAISSLYNSPTIEKLSQLLDRHSDKKDFRCLVPIRTGGKGMPLFIVHGAGGNVLIYRDLSKYIMENIPIYGLQSYGLETDCEPLTTIEEMAKAYIEEIKKVQANGPYFLCGYCMGGTVALEIAIELRKMGNEVLFLALLETYNWSELPSRSVFDKMKFLIEKFVYHFKNFNLLSNDGKWAFLRIKTYDLKKRTRIWLGKFISTLTQIESRQANSMIRQAKIWKLNDKACFAYRAKYYDGKITVILPQKRYSVHSVPEAMWNKNYAEEIDLIILPCYPAGMLVEPFVQELAKVINKNISKVIHPKVSIKN